MKIGIVSDAHGNKHGTKLCLDYLSGKIDELYFLGDSIGYFPDGSQVIELLLNANAKMIMGNHEAMLLGYLPLDSDRDKIYRIRQTGDSLNEQQWKEIKSLPTFIEKEIGDRKILFVHASPWDHLMGYVYPNSDLERFSSLTYDVIFMGHTHRPFIENKFGKKIVNVGSCGLPRDNGSLASCCIFDSELNTCEIFRIPMDIAFIKETYKNMADETALKALDRESSVFFGQLIQ